MLERDCTVCHQNLPLEEFYKSTSGKNGRMARCKKCFTAANKKVLAKKLESSDSSKFLTEKECSSCNETKSLGDFFRSKTGKFQRMAKCKVCFTASNNESAERNQHKKVTSIPEVKECTTCNKTKSLEEFYEHRKGKFGRIASCHDCFKKSREKLKEERSHQLPVATKKCITCEETKSNDAFYIRRASRDGLHDRCKSCWKPVSNEYYQQNKPSFAARRNVRNRLISEKATPKWLTSFDWQEIRAKYKAASHYTNLTGQPYHVDHIIPLRGEGVCGLNVPWNLEVVTAKYNLQKGNRYQGGW